MSMSKQIKSLTEDIEASYEARKAAVSDIVNETQQKLGKFHKEHQKMAKDLRRSLSSNRVTRTGQVLKKRAENEQELKEMAQDLSEMAQRIAEFLNASEKERKSEFATLIGEIRGVIATIESDTAQTLADFRSNHKEITNALKASLAQNMTNLSSDTREGVDKIHTLMSHITKEHNAMAASLRQTLSSFQKNLSETVDEMMTDLSTDHRQAHAEWENMSKEMAAKRAKKSSPSKKA